MDTFSQKWGVQIVWTTDPPPNTKAVERSIAGEILALPGLTRPENLVFHQIDLSPTETIIVAGREGSTAFHCGYYVQPELFPEEQA